MKEPKRKHRKSGAFFATSFTDRNIESPNLGFLSKNAGKGELLYTDIQVDSLISLQTPRMKIWTLFFAGMATQREAVGT